MNMFWSSLYLLVFALTSLTLAQGRELTLEDVILHQSEKFNPRPISQLQWVKDTEHFSFVRVADSVESLYIADSRSAQQLYRFSLKELNAELAGLGAPPAEKFPHITWFAEDTFYFWKGDSLFVFSSSDNRLRMQGHLPAGAANSDVQRPHLRTAYTLDHSLYIMDEKGRQVEVARSEEAGIAYGESVHRNEFGIRKGTFWSPKGNYLAFYRKDERMVTDYPYIDFESTPARLKPAKYPMAGMNNHIAKIGVYHLKSKKTVWLDTGAPEDQYLTNITWGPKEKYIYVAQINRAQNHLAMVRYEAKTGKKVNTIFEETEDTYIDPQVGPYFLQGKGDQFLWLSRRDGWNHLYHYHTNGTLRGQVTRGEWEVVDVVAISNDNKFVYFTATLSSPLNRDFCRANLEDGLVEKLSNHPGTHEIKLSGS